MTFNGWLQIALFSVLIVLIAKPLGGYMTRVFNGERTFLRPVVRPLEIGRSRHSRGRRTALGDPTPLLCWRLASPASSLCCR